MKTALALGTFDGVHKGHRAVLSLPSGYKKTAVVFILPPKSVLSGKPQSIMTAEDKFRVIKSLGIDEIFPLNFAEIKDMPAEDFLSFLKEKFSPEYISCGFNYRFGRDAAGDTALLRKFCDENGIFLNCCEPVCADGEPVSSTRIRGLLEKGDIAGANRLTAVPFSYTAEVITGDRRGRTIGFPTINQKYPDELLPVRFGVYKSKVILGGDMYDGITNIGIRPTWQTDYIISETYIKDFSSDVYGKTVTVMPLKFVRGEVVFSSAEELKKQIQSDMEA